MHTGTMEMKWKICVQVSCTRVSGLVWRCHTAYKYDVNSKSRMDAGHALRKTNFEIGRMRQEI